jgi:hypothetical protein
MSSVLWTLIVQGALGAFDTLYFHEYRARLPKLRAGSKELKLHAARDFIYSVILITLPWFVWRGWWGGVLVVLLASEIFITMYDFVVEDTTRRSIGGVYPAERVTHAVMGIVYGVFLAEFFPIIREWLGAPTSFDFSSANAPLFPRCISTAMGLGVLASGVRDLAATLFPGSSIVDDKRDSSTRFARSE